MIICVVFVFNWWILSHLHDIFLNSVGGYEMEKFDMLLFSNPINLIKCLCCKCWVPMWFLEWFLFSDGMEWNYGKLLTIMKAILAHVMLRPTPAVSLESRRTFLVKLVEISLKNLLLDFESGKHQGGRRGFKIFPLQFQS